VEEGHCPPVRKILVAANGVPEIRAARREHFLGPAIDTQRFAIPARQARQRPAAVYRLRCERTLVVSREDARSKNPWPRAHAPRERNTSPAEPDRKKRLDRANRRTGSNAGYG